MPDTKTPREELLLKMYDQMFSDINRHILVVWQSVSVLVGAFAVLALAEKKVISIDLAIALVVLIAFWLLAHLIDAGYWYNRNLTIIANIERQFLKPTDIRDIHYYFGKHREHNTMLTHLRIQRALGVGILVLVGLFHLMTRILPGLSGDWERLDPQRTLPYVAFVAGLWYLKRLSKNRNESFAEFLKNSPGIAVDTTGVVYGVGHGFKSSAIGDSSAPSAK
jgi:hypothetical protein